MKVNAVICFQYQLADRLHLLVLVLHRQEKEMSADAGSCVIKAACSISMSVCLLCSISETAVIKSPVYILGQQQYVGCKQ